MDEPPKPDLQPPPGPLKPAARAAMRWGIWVILLGIIVVAAEANCDTSLPSIGFWCELGDGVFGGLFLLLFTEPLRRVLVRKWPGRKWSNPAIFFERCSIILLVLVLVGAIW